MTHRMTAASFFAALALCASGIVGGTVALRSEGFASYRGFLLGSNVAAAAGVAGVAPSAVRVLHTRPALLQELEWRPSRWPQGASAASTDPVGKIVLSFLDDRLYSIAVHYIAERTDGMTAEDVIEAVSTVYGPRLAGAVRPRADARTEAEAGTRIADWGTATQAVALYRTLGYGSSFRLVISEPVRVRAARLAESDALRLDEADAPRREAARQAQERAAERAAAARARDVNRAGFQP